MNDELEKLQRQLEEATAAGRAVDPSLDAETKSLRETWLAFGELLEKAQPTPNEPLRMPPMPQPKRSAHAWIVAAVVVAVSLLAAVTIVWNLDNLGVGPGRGQIAKDTDDTPTPKDEPVPQPPETAVVSDDVPKDENAVEDELAWDDSLDDQIAMAGQYLVEVQQDWYELDDAYDSLQDGVEQIGEEFDETTL